MRTVRSMAVALAVAWCAAAGVSLLAEERANEPPSQGEKKPPKQQPGKPAVAPATPAAAEPEHVYTNEDLDRLPPDPAETRRAKAAAPGTARAGKTEDKPAVEPQDPLKQLEDEQARAAGVKAQIAAAEQRLVAAEARVKELERRALAVKNPFLARPEIPPEQAQEWNKMNGAERLKATEEEIKRARGEADEAKAALEKLRATAGVH